MGRLGIENGKESMKICVFPDQFCSECMILKKEKINVIAIHFILCKYIYIFTAIFIYSVTIYIYENTYICIYYQDNI